MRDAEREFRALELNGQVGTAVRSQQLMAAMTAISGALGNFWMEMGDVVRAGQEEARTLALKASFKWDAGLLAQRFSKRRRAVMEDGLLSAGHFNVEAMLARIYKTRLPLSQQVYKTAALSQGWVETRIDNALARGLTVQQMADEVRQFVDPRTNGGASYAAMRLARTEINSAYHAVSIGANEGKPWNEGMMWRLSGSHPIPDICDAYARDDHNGLGRGVFPLRGVPRKPHPNCLCCAYPKTVTPDEWIEAFQAGKYDRYLAETYSERPA